MRRAVEFAAIGTAAAFLADTLDWLNLWHGNTCELEANADQAPPTNHLFPHL